MRSCGARKSVSIPKQVFKITSASGESREFTVTQEDKLVQYTLSDVKTFIDACLYVIEDIIKSGDMISIKGFGTLGVHKRAARKVKRPGTTEWCDVKERYVPKFSFGDRLRTAAKIYELSMLENREEFDEDDINIEEDVQEEEEE